MLRALVHLESKATSKACQTCNMIRHNQSPSTVGTLYSSILKDIQGYSEYLQIFRDIDAYSTTLIGM